MDLTCIPDLGVVIPPDDLPHATLRERVAAAVKTIEELAVHGMDPEVMHPDADDVQTASDLLLAHAKDEAKTDRALTQPRLSALKPAVILELDEMLTEFGHSVVKNAVQIRTFVTNKLLLESANPDPRVRIRALELLGKISDVGLFTERSEVTVTHRSTEELRKSLREKLDSLRSRAAPQEISDATVIDTVPMVEDAQPGGLLADLDAELGPKA